jgi:Skp family chaperone for outer membrane proteins
MTPRLLVWVCIACVMPMTIPPVWSADAIGKAFNQQVTQPVQDAVAIRQTTQKEQEQWRDDQHKLMALYDKLQSEQSRLLADREAFQENIRSAHKRITEKEKQLADIEQLRTRIEPFLQESAQALSQQLAQDLPFLPEERRQRVARLDELLTDPDVAISEKYRKVMEAWLVEAEYGNTIEVYQQTIAVDQHEMLVNILRLGRISLFFQSLDQGRCGFFDVAAGAWQPLPTAYNRTIGAAIDIGTKRKPVELLSMPLGRISVK